MACPRYSFAAIATSLAYCHFCIIEPILALRLVEYGLNTMQIAFFFCLFSTTYFVSAVFMKFMPKKIEKRVRMILAAVLFSIGCFLLGPSEILGFSDSLTLMGIG